MEEFIAVVFGNEVWMGLVDFKSDKSAEDIEEEIGMAPLCERVANCSSGFEEEFGGVDSKDVSDADDVDATEIDSACL